MGQCAAKEGDRITATDTHLMQAPNGVKTPLAGFAFSGPLADGLSPDVRILGRPAATLGDTARNTPPHVATAPAMFAIPPSNMGAIVAGSATVRINGRPAARNGDAATTCNDPVDLPVGQVVADGTVRFG